MRYIDKGGDGTQCHKVEDGGCEWARTTPIRRQSTVASLIYFLAEF